MNLRFATVCLMLAGGLSLHGQQDPSRAQRAPMAAYLQRAFAAVSGNLLAAAETMPAGDYGFRPAGAAAEVRTFAQLVAHTIEVFSFMCAAAKEEPNPLGGRDLQRIEDKARLIDLLKSTTDYCSRYHAELADAQLASMVRYRSADGGERPALRANMIVFNIAHANEHYGNVVTYLRAKGLVPPARPAQAGWGQPVTTGDK